MSFLTGRPGILVADHLPGRCGGTRATASVARHSILLSPKPRVGGLPRGSAAPDVAIGDGACRPNRDHAHERFLSDS